MRRRPIKLTRRHARELEGMPSAQDQMLAWHMKRFFVGRGLTQTYQTITAGRVVHAPQVISVAGPPIQLDIRMLPGQAPEDFAKHAPAMAYHFSAAEVRIVPLGPSLIRLVLLPRPR